MKLTVGHQLPTRTESTSSPDLSQNPAIASLAATVAQLDIQSPTRPFQVPHSPGISADSSQSPSYPAVQPQTIPQPLQFLEPLEKEKTREQALPSVGSSAVPVPGEEHYQKGLNFEKNQTPDYRGAYRAYRDAFNAGHSGAAARIGVLHWKGLGGVTRSPQKTLEWFEKAPKDPLALMYKGICLMTGEGITKDYNAAKKCFEESIAAGNFDANVQLVRLYEEGWGAAKDYDEAFYLYEGEADRGSPEGMFRLANMYNLGRGVDVDKQKAEALYKAAKEAGYVDLQSVTTSNPVVATASPSQAVAVKNRPAETSPVVTPVATPTPSVATASTSQLVAVKNPPAETRLTFPSWLKSQDEAVYGRFLKGALIYSPTPGNDVGKIVLPISALGNPLEGTFDLSKCGDTGKYLSISTGYRQGKKAENASKVEIWFAPRFLIEKELNTTAKHFQAIFPAQWNANAPVGIFWTWGGWDPDDHDMDYLTNESMDNLSKIDLYENWKKSACGAQSIGCLLDAGMWVHGLGAWRRSAKGTRDEGMVRRGVLILRFHVLFVN